MKGDESVGLFSFFKSSARADAGGFGSVPHIAEQIAARRARGLTESQTKARPGGHEGRKEYEMYGTIIIKTAEAQAQFKTSFQKAAPCRISSLRVIYRSFFHVKRKPQLR